MHQGGLRLLGKPRSPWLWTIATINSESVQKGQTRHPKTIKSIYSFDADRQKAVLIGSRIRKGDKSVLDILKENTQLLKKLKAAMLSNNPNFKHLQSIQKSLRKAMLVWLEERQWRHMIVTVHPVHRDLMQVNGGEYWHYSNHCPLISAKQVPNLQIKSPLKA